ncbi:MAG: hypothetical protein IT560_09985 [Alphaproteobacteria bacterium]|nr:hypothetical protein [Alphaproteobacteria bacterium]
MSMGRHEVPQDSFDEITAEKSVAPHALDLKSVLPDLFVSTQRVPRLVAQAWRAAADDVLDETPGVYTYRGGTLVDIAFFLLPVAAARGRVRDIGLAVAAAVTAPRDTALSETSAPPAKTAAKDLLMKELVAQMESEIHKLNREGLGQNPGDEMVRLWAARAMHDMYHSRRNIPLLPQMMDMVAQSDISYVPFFDLETAAIGGAYCGIASPVAPDKYNTGEIMRQDLAMLFGAAVQVYYLRSRLQESSIIVPLRLQTAADFDVAALYTGFLARVAPDVAASLMVEVSGLPAGNAPLAVAESINAISNGVRSCLLDMGPDPRARGLAGALHNPLAQFPVLHGCGFSLKGAASGDWRRAAKNFVACYRDLGLKTYIKDVSAPADIEAAKAIGFTYIIGDALGQAQRIPVLANKNL